MIFGLYALITVAFFFLNSALVMSLAHIANRFVDAVPAFGYHDSMWIAGGLMLMGVIFRTVFK